MKNYVECHQHIQSFDSASTVDEFVKRELELGTGYITTTDHASLSVCKTLYDKAIKNGIKSILGCELYHRDDNCEILKNNNISKINDTYKHFYKYGHLTSHFMDYEAYKTAVKLLSNATTEVHGSQRKPLFNWNNLEKLGSKNVSFTSSCLVGHAGRHLKDHGNAKLAEEYYLKTRSLVKPGNYYVEIFPHVANRYWVKGIFVTINIGDSVTKYKFYDDKKLKTNEGEVTALELFKVFNKKNNKHKSLTEIKNRQKWDEQPHNIIVSVENIEDFYINDCSDICPDGDLQKTHNQFMYAMAKKHGDKILIASDSHYAYKEGQVVQDIRLMSSGGNWKMPDNQPLHRKSSEEAFNFFNNSLNISLKEFEEWIENSYEWAHKFDNFKFEYKPSLPSKFYPEDSLKYALDLIKKHGRMDWSNLKYVERLTQEINLFHKNGTVDLLPYFFPFEETCELYAKNNQLTGVGRGSGAGVLLNYLLNITHIDPLKYDLSLDRFLTLDRIASGKFPDCDVDHPNRDLLVGEDDNGGFLKERFGDHYCQLSADSTLHLRSAVKDTARALLKEVPEEINELTKQFAKPPQGITDKDFVFGYDDSGNWESGSIEYDNALKTYIKKYPDHWKIVQSLLGLVRSSTRHACLPAGEKVFIVDENGKYIKTPIELCDNKNVLTGQGSQGLAKLIYSGKKEVKIYELNNNKIIRATPDHKVLTKDGWMTIEQAFIEQKELIIHKFYKYSKTHAQSLAALYGGEFVSPVFKRSIDYYNWKCKNGHITNIQFCEVKKRGLGCRICRNIENKYSKKEILEIALNKGMYVSNPEKYVSYDYRNLQFKHLGCQKTFIASLRKIIQSTCPRCRKYNKPAIFQKEEAEEYIKSKDGKLLEWNNRTFGKSKYECCKGHRWLTSWYYMKSSQSWCPKCTVIKFHKNNTNDEQKTKKLARKSFYNYRRQDLKKGYETSITIEDVLKARKGYCVYCLRPSSGLDRIDNSKGHLKDNCVHSCVRCNWVKGNWLSYKVMLQVGQLLKKIDP